MASLLYLHGFLSSSQSLKARQTEQWLAVNHPHIAYFCPQLSPYPAETQGLLETLVESLLPEPVYLMGSSLGGFWANWLAEKYDLRALLINPAVRPQDFMPKYLGLELKNYHSEQRYCLQPQHIDEIERLDIAPKRLENYWLLVQTGDATLDYRCALHKYAGAKHTIEQGGDHSFQDFERFLAPGLAFLRGC